MKIYRPVLTDRKTQGFGENLACVKADGNGTPLRPFQVVPGLFPGTCPVGSTKFYPAIGLKGHNGWDNVLYHGEPIYFPVVFDDPQPRLQVINEVDADGGIGVNVYCLDPIPFSSIPVHEPGSLKMIERQYAELGGKLYPMWKFWHCLSTVVADHGFIKPGQMIAYGDTTGASSGDHLHWCMKIHTGNGFSIDSDNGYTGAFDHLPYYENKFVLDVLKPPPFQFTKTLSRGTYDPDVSVLQAFLVRNHYMEPIKAEETGYYGPKTQSAVFAFQLENIELSYYERYVMRGSTVGPKTIAVLNKKLST